LLFSYQLVRNYAKKYYHVVHSMIIIDVQLNVIMEYAHHVINNQFFNVAVDNQVNQHHA
jgi:hypothetical protein